MRWFWRILAQETTNSCATIKQLLRRFRVKDAQELVIAY